LGVALEPFWKSQGSLAEGGERIQELLALDAHAGRRDLRVSLCLRFGELAVVAGHLATAAARLQEALAIARELAEPRLTARALGLLASHRFVSADFASACALALEGIAAARIAKENVAEIYCLCILAWSQAELGDDSAALEFSNRALLLSHETGYQGGAASALLVRSIVQLHQRNLPAARALIERAMQQDRMWNLPLARLTAMVLRGSVLLEQLDLAAACSQFEEALLVRRDMLGGAGSLAPGLEGFAQLAGAIGQSELAFRLAGAAAVLRQSWIPLHPTESALIELWLAPARASAGGDAAASAFVAGRALDPG
jgi:hypothetical protein